MQKKLFLNSFSLPLFLMALFILLTSENCSNSSSSSGSDACSPSSIRSYEFERVYLKYDFSGKHNMWNNLYLDAGDLAMAHYTDGTQLSGYIDNLYDILANEANYPNERKPEIRLTFKPVSCEDKVVICKQADVSINAIDNVPEYGVGLSSLIIKIKSIKTYSHNLQLVWSKTFDINQQWWDSVKDKDIVAGGSVSIESYTKSEVEQGLVLIRPKDEDYEVVGNCCEGNMIYIPSDFDLEDSDEEWVSPPTLDGKVYIEGEYSDDYVWDKPIAVDLT